MPDLPAPQDGYDLLTVDQLAARAYEVLNALRIRFGGQGVELQRRAEQNAGMSRALYDGSGEASTEIVQHLDGLHELIQRLVADYRLMVAYGNSANAGQELKRQLAEIVRGIDAFAGDCEP